MEFLKLENEDLQKKGSLENQRLYILKVLQNKTDELLERWREKHEIQEKEHDSQFQKKKANYEYFLQERKDPFSWLNLKSKLLFFSFVSFVFTSCNL